MFSYLISEFHLVTSLHAHANRKDDFLPSKGFDKGRFSPCQMYLTRLFLDNYTPKPTGNQAGCPQYSKPAADVLVGGWADLFDKLEFSNCLTINIVGAAICRPRATNSRPYIPVETVRQIQVCLTVLQ